jgi:hypothetical protein
MLYHHCYVRGQQSAVISAEANDAGTRECPGVISDERVTERCIFGSAGHHLQKPPSTNTIQTLVNTSTRNANTMQASWCAAKISIRDMNTTRTSVFYFLIVVLTIDESTKQQPLFLATLLIVTFPKKNAIVFLVYLLIVTFDH